jgi:hypothetical protein
VQSLDEQITTYTGNPCLTQGSDDVPTTTTDLQERKGIIGASNEWQNYIPDSAATRCEPEMPRFHPIEKGK